MQHELQHESNQLARKGKAYLEGYEAGFKASIPNFSGRDAETMASYVVGIIDGLEHRREGKTNHFLRPEWMTDAQLGSLLMIYFRDNTILPTFPTLLKQVQNNEKDGYCYLPNWKGMFLGIEKDGYAHS